MVGVHRPEPLHVGVGRTVRQPGQERQLVVRLDDHQLVGHAEVDDSVGPQDPADLGHDVVGIDDVLVDVVEHHDVEAGVGEGEGFAVGAQEPRSEVTGGAGSGQPRYVDVDPDRDGPSLCGRLDEEPQRAAQVEHPSAHEVVGTPEVGEHPQDPLGLLLAAGLVQVRTGPDECGHPRPCAGGDALARRPRGTCGGGPAAAPARRCRGHGTALRPPEPRLDVSLRADVTPGYDKGAAWVRSGGAAAVSTWADVSAASRGATMYPPTRTCWRHQGPRRTRGPDPGSRRSSRSLLEGRVEADLALHLLAGVEATGAAVGSPAG